MFYCIACIYLNLNDLSYLLLFPIGLMAIYFAVYQTQKAFLAITFFTPLSINIEEFGTSLGLFLPTEPLLFGLMLLFIWIQFKGNILDPQIWKNKIIWAVLAYLFWLFVTSITSSSPIVSLKFLLAKLWFIIPILFFGTTVYREVKQVRWFIWLLCSGMIIVMLYTLIVHAGYRFGEKEGHWVMSPFFKDHTIYGAIVALITPLLFGLYFSRKHTPLTQAILIGFIVINLVALYFSYTRAAWLSIIAAVGLWTLIHFRVKFSLIASTLTVVSLLIFLSWDTIKMELDRNKSEHTTEEFGERLQSATNVSTDASNLERINRWSCAVAMFQERPVVGFGPGTYAFEYARFQEPENLTIISTNFGDMGNAHSEYLGPLAETGFPGLVFVLLIVAAIFYHGITLQISWPKEDRETRVLLLACVLSLFTYFIHGILNNYLDTDKAAVPIWTMSAIFIAFEVRLRKLLKENTKE